MQAGVREALAEIISQRCREEEAVVAAYLFGSFASGRMGPASDIDVGVLVEPGREDDFPVLAFTSSLERRCGQQVDLVLLNRAGELLKYQVRRYGRLIFERDPKIRKRFEVTGRKLYEDFLYLHGRYVRSVLYGAGNQKSEGEARLPW